MSPSSRPYGRARTAIGIGFLVLFLFALGVFLLPFAFPTEGALVTRFTSVDVFSPNTPGGRPTAEIAIRMSDPGRVTLTVTHSSQVIRRLLDNKSVPKGWLEPSWDGTNDHGQPVPDGSYTLDLAATSGPKRYKASRHVTVDRTRPTAPPVTATSASLGVLPAGTQCAVSATPSTNARIEFVGHASPGGSVLSGPQFIAKDTTAVWNWDGRGSAGQLLRPGLYHVTVSELSVNGFAFAVPTTCWIGNLFGAVSSSGLPPQGVVQVQLTTTNRQALAGDTPVTLQLFRRIGTPGVSNHIFGPAVGARVTTTAAPAQITIPVRLRQAPLWIRADAPEGIALIAIGPSQ